MNVSSETGRRGSRPLPTYFCISTHLLRAVQLLESGNREILKQIAATIGGLCEKERLDTACDRVEGFTVRRLCDWDNDVSVVTKSKQANLQWMQVDRLGKLKRWLLIRKADRPLTALTCYALTRACWMTAQYNKIPDSRISLYKADIKNGNARIEVQVEDPRSTVCHELRWTTSLVRKDKIVKVETIVWIDGTRPLHPSNRKVRRKNSSGRTATASRELMVEEMLSGLESTPSDGTDYSAF